MTAISTDNSVSATHNLVARIARLVLLPERLDHLHEKLEAQDIALSKLEALSQRQTHTCSRMEQGVELLQDARDLNKEASKRQSQLQEEHYQRHVIDPLVRTAMGLRDLTTQCLQGELSPKAAISVVRAIHAQVLELLSQYGCEVRRTDAGEDFDPKNMRPAKFVKTSEMALNGKVALSLQEGLSRNGRHLRPEQVELYRYEAPSKEEGEDDDSCRN